MGLHSQYRIGSQTRLPEKLAPAAMRFAEIETAKRDDSNGPENWRIK
jgi:hypothetical protein